jgi:hypothetical protein
MSYPMDPKTTFPNGSPGVLPIEMPLLRNSDFRSYVWLRWFSTSMLIFWPFIAIALAGTGFEQAAGREYLLSLPVSRSRAMLTRLAVVMAELALVPVLPTLLLCAMAPLRGEHYPLSDALAHAAILYVAGSGLVGLTMFLRTTLTDTAAYLALGALVVLVGLFTFVATGSPLQRLPADERRRVFLHRPRPVGRACDERRRRRSARVDVPAARRSTRFLKGAVK